jgi:hypothetical protein
MPVPKKRRRLVLYTPATWPGRVMNRSAGVTISAMVVLLGSALALLTGVMMLFASSSGVSVPQNQVQFFKYFMLITAVLLFVAGAWGISTGMALLRLREWSRVSIMVFGALLVFLCIPGLLMFLMVPFPPPGTAVNPQLTPNLLAGMRIFLTLFYAALAVLGGWWLYFFNKQSTKEQFLKLPGVMPRRISDDSMIAPGARPLSITLIAWYLLISAFVGVLGLSVSPPIFFFGFFFKGTFASLIMFALALVQSLTAFGLLKLRPWGRTLAIYYFQFLIFNSLTMVLIPGTQARFDQAMGDMMRDVQGASNPAQVMHFPLWLGAIFAVPLLTLLLWVVVSRKDVFRA